MKAYIRLFNIQNKMNQKVATENEVERERGQLFIPLEPNAKRGTDLFDNGVCTRGCCIRICGIYIERH